MKTEQEIVSEFIKEQRLAVLGTVGQDGQPNSAVVGIFVGHNFEIVFGTFRTSRKVKNLQNDQRVSLVIGWDKGRTVQYQGQAKPLSGQAVEEFAKAHLADMSSLAKFLDPNETVFYKISPTWVRYSDLSKEPWEQFEFKF